MSKADKAHMSRRLSIKVPTKCHNCGIEFPHLLSRPRKYCSDKCARVGARKRVFDAELGLKRCAKCQEWKPLDEFPNANNRSTTGAHGKQGYCRPCNLVKSNEWAEKNPEEKKSHRHKAYWKNPEKHRAAKRNLPKDERERKNKRQAIYRVANADKVRAWNLARFHTLRAAGKITRDMMLRLLTLQKNKCAVCGIGFDKTKKHLDHIKPISAGGTNEFVNLQFLCAPCNLAKQAREPIEFMRSKGFLL